MAVETTEVLPLAVGRQTELAGSAGPAGPAGPARSAGDELATLEAGLDALDAPAAAKSSWRARALRSWTPPLIAALVLLLVWHLVVLAGVKPVYALPGPVQVWEALRSAFTEGSAQAAVANSLRRGVLGFLASVVGGSLLGVLLSQVPVVRRAVGPLLSGLQSLPSVAWVPAAILWFGLSDAAIYAVVLLGAVPSIANGLLAGVDQIPPSYARVAQVLGAGRLTALRFVTLPAALPGYLAGLRQGWAFAWRSLMAAELIAYSPQLGPGLGQLLDTGRELSDMPLVLASILLILGVGVAIETLVFAPLSRRLLSTRGLGSA